MDSQLVTYGSVIAGILLLMLVTIGATVMKRRPKEIDTEYYKQKWEIVHRQASKKESWPLAIINADKLLDGVLKKHKYKGKTMGERLVAAQHDLTRNDSVWFGHKLRNRLVHEEEAGLRERDVKAAISGLRQAMHDLGALK